MFMGANVREFEQWTMGGERPLPLRRVVHYRLILMFLGYFRGWVGFFVESLLFFPDSPYLCSPQARTPGSTAEGPSSAVHRGWVSFGINTAPVH